MPSPLAFRRAAARFRKAREQLEKARADVYAEIPAARESGMTLEAIAKEMGVSRQRVMDILRRG